MDKPISIFGAGGFGREVLMLLRQINAANQQWQIKGFFDDNLPAGETVHTLPLLGSLDELNHFPEELYMVAAIGDSQLRKKVVSAINNPNIHFPHIIHPRVEIHPFQHIYIGEGSMICAGSILEVDINIGKHVAVSLACTIGHDAVLEDFVTLMPGAHIAGKALLQEACYIGSGAVILNGINVGKNAVVGAGAVVTKDVPDNTTVVGVPARVLVKKSSL